ncbi:hypothetical protein PS685_03260 [Pseudomonas fluorescens]|uniref:Uncharacterized protein n=1 Tax=Pseudomonas fluorescens TaxID=294 RepID=A0A5E6Z1R6_PSEFL|nr:hypothetical protein PS685_03260 [Pseudomonas fluorescens]
MSSSPGDLQGLRPLSQPRTSPAATGFRHCLTLGTRHAQTELGDQLALDFIGATAKGQGH